MSTRHPEPAEVAQMVEQYVDKAHSDAAKYDNSTPLDSGGVYSLHMLAADIYAMGWAAGHLTGYDTAHKDARRAQETTP